MKDSDIRAFLAVVENGSITKAASSLYLNQSTLSLRIQALEDELGAPLFIRSKGIRKIRLTPQGEHFIPIAREWASLWKHTKEAMIENPPGELRLISVYSLSSFLLAHTTISFINHYPDTRIKINSNRSEPCYHIVESNEAEAAIVTRSYFYANMHEQPLFEEPYVLLCNNSSPYQDGIAPDTLNVEYEIYIDWNLEYLNWHEHWFGSTPVHKMHTDNIQLAEYVLSHEKSNWTIVPQSIAALMAQNSHLRICQITNAPENRIARLISKKRTTLSDTLLNYLSELKTTVLSLGINWIGPDYNASISDK